MRGGEEGIPRCIQGKMATIDTAMLSTNMEVRKKMLSSQPPAGYRETTRDELHNNNGDCGAYIGEEYIHQDNPNQCYQIEHYSWYQEESIPAVVLSFFLLLQTMRQNSNNRAVCVRVCVCVYVRVCMYVCACVYVCVHVCVSCA